MYQVSIKVESPREVSAAEMVNRPAVHDKVMHPYSLRRQTVRLLRRGSRVECQRP